MNQEDDLDKDGIRNDGVRHDLANPRLHIYRDVRQQLSTFQTPTLLHAGNAHERLFVATLDGTGNDVIHDPEHATNVGLIYHQVVNAKDPQIGVGYVAGPGTQQHSPFVRAYDGMTGVTSSARVEQMYQLFIEQAWDWKRKDPSVQISVAGIGFSRGADEIAQLARLIEDRGIQDPLGAKYTRDVMGLIQHVEYTNPPLVPPHEVLQVVALFDPVGTGEQMREDRRLPPSVISGIQLTALDEHRGLFKSDRIIDPGITPDGRFAGIHVPGAHSDVGGGYHRNGLAMRSGNVVIDYVNGLSDKPILARNPEPDDPRLNVIHHSEEGMLLFRMAPKIERTESGGYNERVAPYRDRGEAADPYNAEPRNKLLADRFEWQTMPNGALAVTNERQKEASVINRNSSTDDMFNALCSAAMNRDDATSRDTAWAYRHSDAGQMFLGMGQAMHREMALQQHVAFQDQLLASQAQTQSAGLCR